MKKFLKFAAPVACLLALVGFILLMATPALHWKDASNYNLAGTTAIFGDSDHKLAWPALLAWIFTLVGMLALICGSVIPFLKKKELERFAPLAVFCGSVLVLVAGVLVFFTRVAYLNANGLDKLSDYIVLNGGYIAAAIILLVGGLVGSCPTIVGLVSKK